MSASAVRASRLPSPPAPVPPMLHALDLLGCAVLAVSGALAAGRERLDLLVALDAEGGGHRHLVWRDREDRAPGGGRRA